MSLLNTSPSNFTLLDQDSQKRSLTDLKGKKVLIVFYPKDETPVCTAQLCSYSNSLSKFQSLGVEVLAINKDSIASHKQFQKKYDLKFPLLSDEDGKVCEAFGMNGLLGTKRAVFLLDESGKIIYEHVEFVSLFYRKDEELLLEIQKFL